MKVSLRRQQGIGFVKLVLLAVIIVFVAVIGVKLVPYYLEFYTVYNLMQGLKAEGGWSTKSKEEIFSTVNKRLDINAVTSVDAKQFKYKKLDRGFRLSVEYQVQKHLVGNVDALLNFKHQVEVVGS